MALGGIYETGTVTIGGDRVSVTGVGTLWTPTVEIGDWLFVGAQVGLVGAIVDDTHLTLESQWQGTLPAAAVYSIIKMSWLRYDPALTQSKVRQLLEALHAQGTFLFVEGDEPDDAMGEDGQWALKTNVVPWQLWLKVDGVWVQQAPPAGIRWRGVWSSALTYSTADGVEHLGSSYIARTENTNQPPDLNPDDWDLMAGKGDPGPPGPPGTLSDDSVTPPFLDADTAAKQLTFRDRLNLFSRAGDTITTTTTTPLLAFSLFGTNEARGHNLVRSNHAGAHPDLQVATLAIEGNPIGSGKNGPQSDDIGLAVGAKKVNWNSQPSTAAYGQLDGIYVDVRNGGPTGSSFDNSSDSCAMAFTTQQYGINTGYAVGLEGHTYILNAADGSIARQMGIQLLAYTPAFQGGPMAMGINLGTTTGVMDNAIRVAASGVGSSVSNLFTYVTDVGQRFGIDGLGQLSMFPFDGVATTRYTLRNNAGAFSLVNNAGTVEFFKIAQNGVATLAAATPGLILNTTTGATKQAQIYQQGDNFAIGAAGVAVYQTIELNTGLVTLAGGLNTAGNIKVSKTSPRLTLDSSSGITALDFSFGGVIASSVYDDSGAITVASNAAHTAGMYIAHGGSAWTTISDERMLEKQAAQPVTMLDRIPFIQVYEGEIGGRWQLFVKAQEFHKCLPHLVEVGSDDPTHIPKGLDDPDAWGVAYDRAGVAAFQLAKEVYEYARKEIAELKQRLAIAEAKL